MNDTYIIGRDRDAGKVLLGGYGMGYGIVWHDPAPWIEALLPPEKTYPEGYTWDEAPEVLYPGCNPMLLSNTSSVESTKFTVVILDYVGLVPTIHCDSFEQAERVYRELRKTHDCEIRIEDIVRKTRVVARHQANPVEDSAP
jgi:hypothetical protein